MYTNLQFHAVGVLLLDDDLVQVYDVLLLEQVVVLAIALQK